MLRPLTLGSHGFVLMLAIVLAFTIAAFTPANALASVPPPTVEEVHAAEHAGEHHVEGSKVPELPNLVGTLHHGLHDHAFFGPMFKSMEGFAEKMGFEDPLGTPFTALENLIFAAFVIIVLSLFFISAYKRRSVAPPKVGRLSRRATFAEIIVLFFEDFFGAILGKQEVRRHLPIVGTLFIYILALNTLGLIFLGKAATANLSFNAGMALVVVIYVHAIAIRKSPLGYLAHYPGTYPSIKDLGMGPLGGLVVGFIIVLFTVIHVMEAFIQPVSLSLRLFGNMLGKDVLLGVFGGQLMPWVPLHTPFLFLGLLLGSIQALIFSLLTAVYITLWTPHEHHAHDAHDDHGAPAAGHA